MKACLNLEEFFLLLLAMAGLWHMNLGIAWYWWIPIFLSPDISMLGYLLGKKAGAFCYNFFHHKGVAAIGIGAGFFGEEKWVLALGLLLLAHSCFDRLFGYGLKYATGFKDTHLGRLPEGKNKNRAV